MARCPESWFAGATSGQAPQLITNNTNDMTLNSKTTSVKKRLEAQVVFAIGPLWFGGTANFQQTYRSSTEEKVDRAHFCQKLDKNMWKKPMPCLRLPRLREGPGCSDTPPTTNSRESASEAKPWLFSDGKWATWWEHLTDMFHGKPAKSGQMNIALEVGNEMNST